MHYRIINHHSTYYVCTQVLPLPHLSSSLCPYLPHYQQAGLLILPLQYIYEHYFTSHYISQKKSFPHNVETLTLIVPLIYHLHHIYMQAKFAKLHKHLQELFQSLPTRQHSYSMVMPKKKTQPANQ